jgi:trehalose 6-phosphate phosphatase
VAAGELELLRERAERAGVLLDFDGSLSAIVSHPDEARPTAGVREALSALVSRYRLVAIVSGRPTGDLRERVAVPGVRYVGLYGMEEEASQGSVLADASDVRSATAVVPEAWVEEKGVSLAVHYRGAPDPGRARLALAAALEPIAAQAGLELVEGKMVLELVPAGRPMKGGAVERIVAEDSLAGVLFAGDDVADLDAFAALDRLEDAGVHAIKVAVRGPETPPALIDAADLDVEGPEGLVELLRSLARR